MQTWNSDGSVPCEATYITIVQQTWHKTRSMVFLKFISPLLFRQKNLGKRFFQLSLNSRLLNVSCLIEMPSCEQLQNPFSSKIGPLTSTRCVCRVQHSHFWAQSRVYDVEKWASAQHYGLQLEVSLSRVSFSCLPLVGPSNTMPLHTHHPKMQQ